MRMLKLAMAAAIGLAAFAAQASALEPEDLIGVWEAAFRNGVVTMDLQADGEGRGSEGDGSQSFHFRWQLDTAAEPDRLLFDMDGNRTVALVRLDDSGNLIATEPEDEAPQGFEGQTTLTFQRVTGDATGAPASP